MPNIAEKA